MTGFSKFLNVLVLLGALQGIIISSLLLFTKQKPQASRILGMLILLTALACFNLYGANNNWFGSDIIRFIADIIPLVVVMPLGPLIYFYVKCTLDPTFKLTKKQRPYFYPVVIDLVPSATVITFIMGLVLGIFKNKPGPWGSFIDDYNVYADIPRWASITFYVWLSARYLRKNKAAHLQKSMLTWLKQFVLVFIVFQTIWLVYLVPYIIPKYSNKLVDTFDWYPIYIPMAAIIYWLGIKGYMAAQMPQTPATTAKAQPTTMALTAASIQFAVESLERCMKTDRLYLNPALNLDAVAQHTGLPQKTISAVLNQHVHKSFNEFVNEYRVIAFTEKMQQPGTENLTIAGIAFDCGFNSQATFQRTFKQVTGMSPTEYRKTALITS